MCLKKIFTSVVLINLCAFAYATEVKTASKTTPKSKASSTSAPATIETPKIAVFNFKGILLEKPPEISFSLDMELQQSLHDLLERLKKAEKDESLKAVVLTFDEPLLGWAQMQELRSAVKRLRKANKDVYCYLEEAGPAIYQLASAATHICIAPGGELQLAGLYVEMGYLKGLLDKIGLEADIEHIGDYKGAGEPLTRTGPSDQAREMMNWLLADLFDQLVDSIAEGRQMAAEKVRELIDRGPFNPEEALREGLVDELLDADAFLLSLRERHGSDFTLVRDYGKKKGQDIDFTSPFAFFKIIGESISKTKRSTKATVAVVYVNGMIVPGKTQPGLFDEGNETGSTTIRRVLAQARTENHIKAVVLRVDSPGGSAMASDVMWRAIRTLAEVKPVVVSMGNTAASGGYYISVGAPTIFADPGTITGSIGVIGGKLVTKGLWDWLGVSFHEYKFGQNADLQNSNRKFDERQRVLVRKQMEYVYDMFTNCVSKGREGRLNKDLKDLAGGRVFTGKQALAHGLIDRIGGLEDAIACAAKNANISDYQVQVLPEARNFIDLFLKSLTGDEDDDSGKGVFYDSGHWLLSSPIIKETLRTLCRADPIRARAIQHIAHWIEMLGNENTLCVMPDEILIRP